MTHREDRWFTIRLGGDAFFAQLPAEAWSGVPLNLHTHQDPVPGLKVDQWDYDTLKRMARQFGQYYGIDRDGLLYAGGVIQPGSGRPASEVFASKGPGDHRGLVFIDTLDGTAPRPDNLGTIVLDQEYAEGMFIVNAHVLWKTAAYGKPIPALSPPPEGQQSLGSRIPVQLPGIHLQGVLYVAGDVRYAGHLRVYGGVVSEGAIVDVANGSGMLEVWYNHDLREGLVQVCRWSLWHLEAGRPKSDGSPAGVRRSLCRHVEFRQSFAIESSPRSSERNRFHESCHDVHAISR